MTEGRRSRRRSGSESGSEWPAGGGRGVLKKAVVLAWEGLDSGALRREEGRSAAGLKHVEADDKMLS